MGQLFTCSMNCVTSSLSIFQIEKNILFILFFTFLSVLINEIWILYFRSFSFAVKINQEVRNIWQRFSHPNRPFKTTLCSFCDQWCFCHRFGMDWWYSNYSRFFTCKPWHEWLVCYFINEAEATNKVVLSKVSRTYRGILCRLPRRSLLFYKINPLLSTLHCFWAFVVKNRSCS